MVVKVMGLLLRGTTPQMVLPRVQHFAAQSVQLGQRPRTHLQPINSFYNMRVIVQIIILQKQAFTPSLFPLSFIDPQGTTLIRSRVILKRIHMIFILQSFTTR